ncbi:hypothetical protein [Persicobacter sp. CCB-QB2]|uniref:hypothetical protein n=1 Tax=Persicobacter sp. CCB-QB2 TaxID=1561025 RepID=UPI00155DBE55|nr:hypothetical protein [Persicobacter sp. CCB-QB2]
MSFFFRIWTLYMALIVMVPCSDDPAVPHDHHGGAMHQCEQLNHAEEEEDFGETCSPFCGCGCCQKVADRCTLKIPTIDRIPSEAGFKNPRLLQLVVDEVYVDHFQPPRA